MTTITITDEQFVTAFNNLSKAQRIRLIITMANCLAEEVTNLSHPGPDASEEEMAKWNRATLIRDEAHMDSTMWSDELEDEFKKQDFTNEEELAMSLWSIRETGRRVLRTL